MLISQYKLPGVQLDNNDNVMIDNDNYDNDNGNEDDVVITLW